MDHEAPKVSDPVLFTDGNGATHHALITKVWNPVLVDLVFVSSNESRVDQYGRQTERAKGVWLKSEKCAYVNYWSPVPKTELSAAS